MMTLYNQLEQNPKIFDDYPLIDKLDRDILNDTIMFRWGGMDTVYSNPDLFKYYSDRWFQRKFEIIKKMWETTQFEYNPIENYDRKEDYWENNDDTLDVTTGDDLTIDRTTTVDSDGDVTSQVSPFNANTFINDSKSITDMTDTTKEQGGDKRTGKRDEINTREKKGGLRAHGNIGVTTTQDMIEEERRVSQFDIYEWIAAVWADDNLVIAW